MVVKEAAPITVDMIMVGMENICNLEYFSWDAKPAVTLSSITPIYQIHGLFNPYLVFFLGHIYKNG